MGPHCLSLYRNYRENDCGWRSNPSTSLTQFQLDKRIPYGALKACGVGLVLSPSANVGSGNHSDMVLIHYSKRHDAYAFILETLMTFSGVPRCNLYILPAVLMCSYLRNEFNFWMFMESWTLWVSCKVSEAWASLTLQETQSIQDSMNIPKIEFIAYIYILI